MNKLTKLIITVSAISVFLGGCDLKKKDDKTSQKATTIEQIQAEKGKPARVIKASKAKLSDIRKFTGTIEGVQQSNAIVKMGDPISKINIQVGSSVQKDQVLAEFIYTGDNTQYQQLEESVKLQQTSYNRMKELQEKGGVSQQDLDQVETQLKISKMNLETARRATKILAPSTGVVTELNFEVGQTPGLGAVFCTIAKLDQVILKMNITSQDIGLFKKGTSATVTLNGNTLKGKVTKIPLAANTTTRFFPVEVTFNNKGKHLLPGMFVSAEIDAKQVNGIVIPAEAVVYRNGLNTAWTVEPDGTAKRHIVQLGVQTKDDVQILEGINEGDIVMVEGMSKMNDGDKVLVVE